MNALAVSSRSTATAGKAHALSFAFYPSAAVMAAVGARTQQEKWAFKRWHRGLDESQKERRGGRLWIAGGAEYHGRTISSYMGGQRTHKPAPAEVRDGTEKGRERQRELARVLDLDGELQRQRPDLSPNTEEYKTELWRVHGDALRAARIGTSLATLKRLRSRDRAGEPLSRKANCGRKKTEIHPKATASYRAARLKGTSLSAAECGRVARDFAEGHGLAIPSSRTLERRFKESPAAKPALIYANQGPERFRMKAAPHIHRDWSKIDAREVAFGDYHKLDVFVDHPDALGELRRKRLFVYVVMLARPRKVIGYDFRVSACWEGFAAALKMAVRAEGACREYYFDNGGEATKGLGGKFRDRAPRVMEDLGAKPTWALPKAAESKGIIERFFGRVKDELDRHQATFCGGRPGERHEELSKRVPVGQGPLIEEYVAVWKAWLDKYHAEPAGGIGINGLSPNECLKVYGREPARRLPDTALDDVFALLTDPITVGRDGIYCRENRFLYGGCDENVWELQGQKVCLRINPDRADTVVVCDERGKRLFETTNRRLTGVTQEEVREHMRFRRRITKRVKSVVQATSHLLKDPAAQAMETRANLAKAREKKRAIEAPDPGVTIVRPDLARPTSPAASSRAKALPLARPPVIPSAGERIAKIGADALEGLKAADRSEGPLFRGFAGVFEPAEEAADSGVDYARFAGGAAG